jgi:hypothetical protein
VPSLHACRSTLEDPVLSQKAVSLIVSLYLPRDGEVYKDDIVKILSSFAFLPPNERVSWQYAKIVEPMNGMTAVLIPVPDGFNFSGNVVKQGTKRWFIYSLRRSDGSAIRMDLGYRARIRNHGHSCFLCEIVIRSQFHTTYEPEA